MAITINGNECNINDIYRVCSLVATPKDKKKLAKSMSRLAKAQDKMAGKYSKTPFETLQGLSDEKLSTYTRGLDKAFKSFEKSAQRVVNNKKTKNMFFSIKSNPDGSMEYVQDDTGRKATTIIEHLLPTSQVNTRRETISQISELNKSKHYATLTDKHNARIEADTVTQNERTGRDNYYANINKAKEIEGKKADAKGTIDFNNQLAQNTYGNTAAAYRIAEMENKNANERLSELEGHSDI